MRRCQSPLVCRMIPFKPKSVVRVCFGFGLLEGWILIYIASYSLVALKHGHAFCHALGL